MIPHSFPDAYACLCSEWVKSSFVCAAVTDLLRHAEWPHAIDMRVHGQGTNSRYFPKWFGGVALSQQLWGSDVGVFSVAAQACLQPASSFVPYYFCSQSADSLESLQ